MSKPLISVVIPAYNYAEVLPRAIRSVLKQSAPYVELVVVNDGSLDNTDEVVAQIRSEGFDFIYVKQSNGGPSAARNRGIDVSSGQYLIFLDADDELLDNALSLFRQAVMDKPHIDMFIGGYYSVIDNNSKRKVPALLPTSKFRRVKAFLIDKKLSISNGPTLMKRTLFKGYRYPEKLRNVEDLPMFAYVLANYNVDSIREPVANIYRHENSLRTSTQYASQIGMDVVEEIFSPVRLPGKFQRLKRNYYARRSLSLSRRYYLAGDYVKTRQYFLQAFYCAPLSVFRLSYLSKFICSLAKINTR